MKKYLLTIAILFCGIIFLQSCEKEHEAQNVILNETVTAGNTYSLDLSAYGERDAKSSISTQPANYTISQIDLDQSTGRSIYHFSTDTKNEEMEKVVIKVSGKRSGRCNRSENNKMITINFKVIQ